MWVQVGTASNEYPQSMFWSKNKKNRYAPAYPSFKSDKSGFKGVYIARACFPDAEREKEKRKYLRESIEKFMV